MAPHPRPARAPTGSARPETKKNDGDVRNRQDRRQAVQGRRRRRGQGREARLRARRKFSLPVALVVDGAKVTTDAKELEKVAVTGEVLEHTKGPKIRIHKFKNKTGYHKRQGHRQQLTVLKVTGIK